MALLGSGAYTYEVSGEDWGELPEGWTYKEATAVAVDSRDDVYVFNRGGHPIIVYNREGKFLRSWGDDIFTVPHGIAIGPDDTLYCADTAENTVRKFTREGKLLMTLGVKGQSSPAMSGEPFCRPTHLAVDQRNGDLYVSDGYGNARVHKYSSDGRLLFSWGESGTAPGQFNIVHNIDTDRDGYVYVADRENRRVQVFDPNGRFENQWVNLSRAACVCAAKTGEKLVYVGEYFAGQTGNASGLNLGPRVTVFSTDGQVLARLSDQSYGAEPGRFYAPHGIAVDSRGDIYVAEVSYAEFGQGKGPPYDLRSLQKLVKRG